MIEEQIWENWEGNIDNISKKDDTFKYDFKGFDLQKWKNDTLIKLSFALDNKGKNQFTEAFKEIYKKYLLEKNETEGFDDVVKEGMNKNIKTKKILLEKTFDRLIKGEDIESEENLLILEQLFNNAYFLKAFTVFIKKTDKITKENKKILTIKNISNLLEEKINEQKENLEIQKNEREKQELLDTGKVFNADGKYYVHDSELIPAQKKYFADLNEDESLKYGEKNVYFFDDLENANDKIILSIKGENFIIIDSENNKIIYEAKKGEKFIEITKKHNRIRIEKNCGLMCEYDTDLNEKIFDDYEDEYEVKGGKIFNLFINKLKLEIGKLKLPEFIDIEEFLDTPYFGDVVAIAMKDNQYSEKTFSECCKLEDFTDIYNTDKNIFTEKDIRINKKVILKFKTDESILSIPKIIVKKIANIKEKK